MGRPGSDISSLCVREHERSLQSFSNLLQFLSYGLLWPFLKVWLIPSSIRLPSVLLNSVTSGVLHPQPLTFPTAFISLSFSFFPSEYPQCPVSALFESSLKLLSVIFLQHLILRCILSQCAWAWRRRSHGSHMLTRFSPLPPSGRVLLSSNSDSEGPGPLGMRERRYEKMGLEYIVYATIQ